MLERVIVEVPEFLQSLKHLPPGATVRVPDVTWDEYLRILAELEALRPGIRVDFIDGRLYARSPLSSPERYARALDDIAQPFADALGLDWEGAWLRHAEIPWRGPRRGTRRDSLHPPRVRNPGKEIVDLAVDPPPDLVTEVDLTSNSLTKFPVYASFGIPEIWRFDGVTVEIWRLTAGEYIVQPASLAFPNVTPALLTEILAVARTHGSSAARRACKDWIATHL